ncbi:uncharacterized protein [Salminus brasiliensis]|uniref:uncharacterized protein isoform X2 n=1 Tax=Salminus brasiliensis TaxID=930266 RepID=UPI003B836F1B
MAAPFLRVGRLSEQRLCLESSFGILRGTPSVVDFSTKSGTPKRPVRYTSIKKAKPKTIIDISKLLLQRSSDATVSKQSVNAEAALKAARRPASKQSAASSDSAATPVSTSEVAAAASSSESVTPVAVNSDSLKATKFAINPLTMSSSSAEDFYEATASGEQGHVSVNTGQEKVPALGATKNLPSESSPFATSLEEGTTEPRSDPDKIASSPKAAPGTDSGTAPIDVTYSEEVTSVDDTDIASTETSAGVLAATGTVITETVNSQSIRAIDIPVAPEVFIPKISPAGHGSAKTTPVPEHVEIVHALEGSTSVHSPTSNVAPSGAELTRTQMQDKPQTLETLVDLAYRTSSSKTFFEEGTVAPESTPEVKVEPASVLELAVTQPEVPPVVPYENTAEEIVPEKMSSSDVAPEKAVISGSISGIIPVERAKQQMTTEVHGDSASQEEMVAMTQKVLNLTSESEVSVDQGLGPDPGSGEFIEEEIATEEEGPVRKSEAQLDPIQRLFLDKIREYSTKSNSSAMSLRAQDGLVDAGPEYERAFSEELAKLQRLYGNGDLTSFPEFKFQEPVLDEVSSK